MPNCDWGRPCDCSECRRIDYNISCPHCGFENCVSVNGIPNWGTDRDGMSFVDFEMPESPIRDLVCFNCKKVIENAGVYDGVRKEVMDKRLDKQQKIRDGLVCSSCNKIEKYDHVFNYVEVQLVEKDGMKYCQSCYADMVVNDIPDPSDNSNRYEFDKKKLEWLLIKVRKPCEKCGKLRWLNVENTWKKLCKLCYMG